MSDRDPARMTREEIEDELYTLRRLAASFQRLQLRRSENYERRQRIRALQLALNALKARKR